MLRGLIVASHSKADAGKKQDAVDDRYTASPLAVLEAIRRCCNFVKSRAFHRPGARTHTLQGRIIDEFFRTAVTAVTVWRLVTSS